MWTLIYFVNFLYSYIWPSCKHNYFIVDFIFYKHFIQLKIFTILLKWFTSYQILANVELEKNRIQTLLNLFVIMHSILLVPLKSSVYSLKWRPMEKRIYIIFQMKSLALGITDALKRLILVQFIFYCYLYELIYVYLFLHHNHNKLLGINIQKHLFLLRARLKMFIRNLC